MKFLIAPVFALFALGATAANAAPLVYEANPERGAAMEAYSGVDYVPHQRCFGMGSGTAHASCGTRTGGPAGGLH